MLLIGAYPYLITDADLSHAIELVVCAYGDSPWLARCLASLQPQIASGVKLTIATSTPSPFIAALAQQHGARIAVNQHRAGIAADWNFAYQTATAPLVTLCHQDDEYSPDYATAMRDAFEQSPDVLFALCDHIELSSTGPRNLSLLLRIKRRLVTRTFGMATIKDATSIRRRLLSWGNPISCPGVMFNKARLPDFAFDEKFSSNMDWDAWERLCRLPGSVAYVNRPLVGHRVHTGSATTALIANTARAKEDRLMLHRFWPRPVAWLIFQLYRQAYRSNT